MEVKIAPDIIERAAKAIYEARPRCDKCTPHGPLGWLGIHEDVRDNYRTEAKAALEAALKAKH